MDFKLCKKLIDAHHPNIRQLASPDGMIQEGAVKIDGVCYMMPSLEELIKACGDRFDHLKRNQYKKDIFWKAWGLGKEEFVIEEGKTPKIAVANLYLALNKSK